MSENIESLTKVVNKSGFPLQIWLEDFIENSKAEHGWDVVGHEHYWRNQETGKDGFIDLVLEWGALRTVIECKRVLDTKWIFLQPDIGEISSHKARLLSSHCQAGKKNLFGWSDLDMTEQVEKSSFCVVRGHTEKDKPMLERLASIVLDSVECLSEEEIEIKKTELGKHITYVPIIVTTAELQTCQFSAASVSANRGEIEDGKFAEIPFVNFSKGFSTKYVLNQRNWSLKEANKANERSVYVVNTSQIVAFLIALHGLRFDSFEGFPWKQQREMEG